MPSLPEQQRWAGLHGDLTLRDNETFPIISPCWMVSKLYQLLPCCRSLLKT